MPLTVGALARRVGLPVLVDAGLDRVVAWVHSTELTDPTPFLEGGELLLTTGIALGPGGDHADYVRRLVASGVSGLGFGTGLSHDEAPPGLVAAAGGAGLALLEVPRATPFIAITKAVAADAHAALTRTSEAQHALTRAAVTGGPGGVVRRLARLLDGAAVLLDGAGAPVHAAGDLAVPDLAARARLLASSGGPAGAAWQEGERHAAMQVLGRRGFLAVLAPRPLEAGVVNTAASLLTLALARSDEVDEVREELRAERFRLLLAGQAVAGLPEAPFRVFLPTGPVADPPGFWAEVDGRLVVLAHDLDVPAAASSPVDAAGVARGYREALRAREEGVARFEDVAAARLLAPDAAEHAEALLAPLDEAQRETVRVWLSCHGQFDPAAAALGVHRHTVRNRLRRVEELLGRSLEPAGTRAELWFALHARG